MMRPLAGCVFLALLGLVACWSQPVAQRTADVPAAREAERLRAHEPPAAAEVRDLREQELAAGRAAAAALAAGDEVQASHQQRLAAELARLRANAEERERQQRQELAALAADAERRAQAERDEADRRSAAAERASDLRRAAQERQRDQRWAGWGLALAVVAAIALRVIGLPAVLAFGVPAAVAAGCLTLAAWSSVPWLATVLGIILAGVLVLALALVVRHLVGEWTDYARRLGAAQPQERIAADAASRARQPAWVRWLVDRLLAQRRTAPATAES